MNSSLKRFFEIAAITIDPIAVLDYKRWRNKKDREHDELMQKHQERSERINLNPPNEFKN